MKGALIRCVRCKGRKKLFKINGIYSYTNTGGVEIQCPMCLGNGSTKSLEEALEEIKKVNEQHKSEKIKEKDFKDGRQSRECAETA
jgi:phage FluMu protein Com